MSQLQVVLVSLTDDQQRLDDYLSRYAGRLSVTHYSATHETIEVVLTQVWQQSPAAVLIDDADGEDAVFAALKNFRPTTEAHAPAVLMLGPNDVRRAVRAIKAGADDYLNRGELTAEQLMAALETCLTRHQPPIPIANSGAPSAVTTAPTWLPHLVERMPTLLYVFDLVEQRNIYANRLLGELLGYSLEQLKAIGSDLLATIMHPDDFARVPTHFAQFQGIADDEVIEFDFRVRHADGNWRWLSTHEIVFERQADGSPRRILGVSRDATQQKQSELTAKEHEERFRLIAETIRDVFWVADFRIPKILYISPAYTETWGRSPDEVYQNYQLWAETIHPEDRQRVIETAAQQLDQEMLEQEYRIIRPDGSIRWIRDRGFAVRDEAGNPLRTVGIAQDITERRQAESALAANEAKLQSFVESNVVGIIFGDIHGGIFTANDEFLRIVGYTRADLEAGRLQWIEMTPPEYLPLDEKRIAEAQSRGACTPYEKEYIRKDGKRTPVLIGFTLLGDRREESVVFVLDRKARKKTERALRRSEDRLRMAMESAQLGTWDWNLTKDQLTWDANCRAMFGVSADVPISLDVFFQGLHPDDHERLQQCIDDCMNPALGGRYEVEYRTIGIEDGIERWVLAKGQVYFEPNGRPKRFVGTVLDITERKQIELVLRESQERLQMAVKGSGGGLWHWNILTNEDYLSPEWLGMLGFAEGELPHKYSSWEKLIHPEDKAMVMELLYAHLQDETKPYEFEYRLMTKAGAWKWIANYGQVVDRDESGKPTKMAGIHLDISDRKQAEKRLQLSEARYRTLANAVSQLMWINDAAGNIEFFNQQWVDYTGVETLETGVGPWPEVIHPEDIERTYAVRSEAIAAKTSYEIEARIKRYDDTYYWHLVRVEPLFDDNDQVLNWFGTATNIHARKTIEAERERLFDQEKAARESAEQANRVKDEFLAILSHELRSPLNPILGWSQLLQSKEYDRDKTLQALEIIERNAKLQTQLVDDLLDVAKILRGKLELGYAPVNLSAVITAAIETVKTAAAAKSIVIKSDFQPVDLMLGDAGRLQQIVWNLLSNAIKFTPVNGQVTAQLTQTDRHAQIVIADTGKGIQKSFLPHIFESFRQEDISITRQHGGLGVGLAIVRYLTEAHGGTVVADSAGINQGATFTVMLPLATQSQALEEDAIAAKPVASLAGVRILAVDDDPDCRMLLQTLLSEYEAEICVTDSAKAALTQLLEFKPHILISDLGMPTFDGYSLIKQVRSLSKSSGGQVPAIALTAYTRTEDQQKTLAHGFQRHVAKPVDINVLLQTIIELLGTDHASL